MCDSLYVETVNSTDAKGRTPMTETTELPATAAGRNGSFTIELLCGCRIEVVETIKAEARWTVHCEHGFATVDRILMFGKRGTLYQNIDEIDTAADDAHIAIDARRIQIVG